MSSDPFAALVAQGQRKIAAADPAAAVAGVVVLDPAAELSGPHAAVLGALDELLGAITERAGSLPAMARTMLSVVTAQRSMLVESVARMPEDQLRGLLVVLRGRIDAALTDGD